MNWLFIAAIILCSLIAADKILIAFGLISPTIYLYVEYFSILYCYRLRFSNSVLIFGISVPYI